MICINCENEVTGSIGVLLQGAGARVVPYCDHCDAPGGTEEHQLGFCPPNMVPFWNFIAEGGTIEEWRNKGRNR